MDTLKIVVEYCSQNYVPLGKSDSGGRWYPDEEEIYDCCKGIRSPSRSYPWSLYKHCKSKKHITNWVLKTKDNTVITGLRMTRDTAPLYLDTVDPLLAYVRDHLLGHHLDSRPVTQKPIPNGVVG